ncbi:fungal transcriptional regulatory-like protein [Coniochaeta sp. 2T2.1]|nr:fungal transcriptional regulatory-like protein [Coniochaeta sp. 2T2.1]
MELQLKSDPESEQYLASQAGAPSSSIVGENRDSQKKNPVRKRTKTGCLTCRRRRIKCDEAKPRCTNCTKSRRVCEGYNQRITFKEPVSSYHPHPAFFGHSQPAFIPHAPDPLTAAQLAASQLARAGIPPGNLTVIAPKPPEFYHFQEVYPPQPTPSNGPPSATLSQNQFSPHNGPPSSSFNHPHLHTPVSAHAEYPADDFFNVVSPSMTEESDGMFAQYSAFDNRVPQPLSRTPAYQPPDTRDRNEEHSIHYSESQADPYWSPDDEASMGESEDEDGYEAMAEADQAHLESNDLGIQVARRMDRQAEYYDARIRTFTGFVDANNVLDTYTPSSTNSPLNDTQTASVFWYFVNVTGPSMSLYERHPFDPSPMFQGQPVPKARRHIWTYTFPIISFNHPALLQAMLALGSLQMAKLQGIPATASMKHYHLSLRRIAKNYQSPTRRTQPATLAATLLLGFYEVWNSDHAKWCKHMWGARAIIREIPFKDMTKAVLGLKRKRRQRLHDLLRRQQQQSQGNFGAIDPFSVPMDEDISNVQPDFTDVNTGLISQITGTTVTYEDFGHIYNEDGQRKSARKYTDRDVETYEHLSDLYWWYCKMDVYQSILGATSLFMEYDLWTQCAPRGPFNHTGAIFGTYDHLMLLLGRMCNFVAQDINRKRKAARRGQTAAPAGAAGQRPAGMGMAPGQSPPMWAGLVPTSGFVTVPTGFSPPRDATPQSDGSEDIDFEESTAAALREWDSIRKAFEIFRTNLGPDFDPLGPDLGPPQPTPFGPAATYRTFSIAGIWMNYYMGLIALHRAHPTRPPFAMVAAGMAAQETGMWANEIGRIAAGLTMEDCSNLAGISTLVGAAFIESCFCLFVAAVQYRDEAQRHWTVRRLHDIGRLTGWQSAIQIAEGCESAWLKAAQLGKGPPYQRPPDVESQLSQSMWQNPRRIDRRIHELSGEQPASNVLTKSERAHYAMGLLSLENDLERLELGEAG